MEVSGQHQAPATLPREEQRKPLNRRIPEPQRMSGYFDDLLLLPGLEPWTVQAKV
jgi:hypothetical protein